MTFEDAKVRAENTYINIQGDDYVQLKIDLQLLHDAYIALDPNITALENLINKYDMLNYDDYDSVSWDAFQESLSNASQYLNDPALDVWLLKDLENSVENLLPIESNIDELNNLITECERFSEHDLDAGWTDLQLALENAKTNKSNNLMVGQLLRELQDARNNIKIKSIDFDRLSAMISIVEDLNRDNYMDAGWIELSEELVEAKKITPQSLWTEVDAVNLEGAFNSLVLVAGPKYQANIFLSVGTITYFIIAAVLFTGAIVCLMCVYNLRRKQKRRK